MCFFFLFSFHCFSFTFSSANQKISSRLFGFTHFLFFGFRIIPKLFLSDFADTPGSRLPSRSGLNLPEVAFQNRLDDKMCKKRVRTCLVFSDLKSYLRETKREGHQKATISGSSATDCPICTPASFFFFSKVRDSFRLFALGLIFSTMNKKSLLVTVRNRVAQVATSERIVIGLLVPNLAVAIICPATTKKKRKEKKKK